MNATDIIKALRCSTAVVPNRECGKCAYYYRDEPSPEMMEKYGDVPDDFWEGCDSDRIMLDAADMIERQERAIERLKKEAGIGGTAHF